nr:CARDB domain-containing protein [Variovorax terrae]
MVVSKVASSANGTAGATISYTVTLVNLGPSAAQNVTLTDVMSAGLSLISASSTGGNGTATVGGASAAATATTLASGATLTLVVNATVTATTGNVTNTAAGTSTTPDSNPNNNTATVVTSVVAADMSTTFSGFPASAPVGSVVGGTVSFVNVSANTAVNPTVTLQLTPGLGAGKVTVTSVVLGVGTYNNATGVVTFANPVPSSLVAGGTISASVSYLQTSTVVTGTGTSKATNDTNPANNTATFSVSSTAVADIQVTLSVPSAATAGSTVTGTVTFANNGPSAASNVGGTVSVAGGTVTALTSGTVNNGVGSSVVTSSLGAGSSVSYTFTYVVPASGVVTSTAVVTSTTPDSNLANNTASGITAISSLADVSVTLVVPATSAPGSTVTATVTVLNLGPSAAANVTATLTLPGGSQTTVLTLSSLPAGSSTVTVVAYSIPASQTASSSLTWKANVDTTTPESTKANNTATASLTVATVNNASLSGRVWLDANSDKLYTPKVDLDLAGWHVELLLNGAVVGNAITGADGSYTIINQVPGSGYAVRFKNPAGQVIVSTPFNQTTTLASGNSSTGTTTSVIGSSTVVIGGSISNVTLYAGDNVKEQNLPIDPSGIVYDAVSRKPVAGAVVTLIGPDGNPVPGNQLLQGASSMTTDASGIYQFDLLPSAPNGSYKLGITPPDGYSATPAAQGGVAQPGGTYTPPTNVALVSIQPNATAPAANVTGGGAVGAVGTQYFLMFNLTVQGGSPSAGVIHNHIPLDPLASGAILVNKTGNKTVAEVGDSVQYTIRMRNTTSRPIAGVTLEDLLPAGFRYILETARLNNAVLANPAGGVGRALTFTIGTIPANTVYELTYFVRLGVGSQQGDGINRATAAFPGANAAPVRSNTALFKVTVQGGVFSNEGCIVGKVYMDCDGNFVQGNDGGSRELGIPGVRLVMLDGTYIVTDNEGKYSLCGVKPQTHVIKVDRTTLPKGARLVPSSNRNAGVGDSIFVDMKGGEMHRADFIEGSCSPEVMDQVKARRAQGGPSLPEHEKGMPLKLDNRSSPGLQILPAARQMGSTPVDTGVIRP